MAEETLSFDDYIAAYWNYYMLLEDRLIETERYIALDLDVNGDAYSSEYLLLLQAACSEIDVVGKETAKHFSPSGTELERAGIYEWGFYAQQAFPGLFDAEVIYRKNKRLAPFSGVSFQRVEKEGRAATYGLCSGSVIPRWWSGHNKVKHSRALTSAETGVLNYKLANQRNVLEAMAALFLLHRYAMRRLDIDGYGTLLNRSNLFRLPDSPDELRFIIFYNTNGAPCQAVDKW